DAASGHVLLTLPNTAMRVAFLSVSPDGRRAVTAANSGEIRVWDLHGRTPARVPYRHSRWVRNLAITDGGHYATSMSLDGALMWDLESGEVVYTFDEQWGANPFQDSMLDKIPGPGTRYEALLPGGQAIAATTGNKLQVRNLATDEAQPPALEARDGPIQIVRATPDGRRVVTGSADGVGRVWGLPERSEVAALHGHSGAIVDVAIDPEARRVVTASMDHSLKVWGLDSGRPLHTLEGHTAPVSGVARIPGGPRVVSVAQDATVRVWDAETGSAVATFSAENMLVSCAAAPDGLTLVAGEVSGSVHILRLEGAG